jgi:hypothetical protein
MTAFRAKNPSLASQLELVKSNPRHIKKLAADSACEVVEMVADQSLLETLHEVDTRVSVREQIASTLREVSGRVLDTGSSRKPLSVSEKTAKFLKKSPAQAAEKISVASSLDVPMVIDWCKGLSPEDLALVASKIGYCYPLISDKENWVVFQKLLLERISEGDPEVLAAASSRIDSDLLLKALESSGEELSLFLTVAVVGNFDQLPKLSRDGSLLRKRTSKSGEDFIRSLDDPASALWLGMISAKEAAKSLNKDDNYHGWRVVSSAMTASEADLLLQKAEKFGWLDVEDDSHQYYRYHSAAPRYAGSLYDIPGLDEKWQIKLSHIVTDADLRSFLFQGRLSKPSAAVVDAIAASMSADRVGDALTPHSYAHEQEERYDEKIVFDVVSRFVTLTPGLPKSVGGNSYYSFYGRRSSLLAPVLASVLSDSFGENESRWSVFWGLVESAHDTATFQELVLAAEALS